MTNKPEPEPEPEPDTLHGFRRNRCMNVRVNVVNVMHYGKRLGLRRYVNAPFTICLVRVQ